MNKKVIIACVDEGVRRILKNSLSDMFHIQEVIECTYESEAKFYAHTVTDSLVLFDKYFLGYAIERKIFEFHFTMEDCRCEVCFCERGSCPIIHGLRLYNLKADSLIDSIEKPEQIKVQLSKVLGGYRTFPKTIQEEIAHIESYDRHQISDVTSQEEKIAAYLSRHWTMKKIAAELNTTYKNVDTHSNAVKAKIGYVDFQDFYFMNRQAFCCGM